MDLPQRKKNRLSGYDYSSSGVYFVTICTEQSVHLLCDEPVGDGFPVPNHWGEIVSSHIRMISQQYPCVKVEKYIIMPNHLHILLSIRKVENSQQVTPSLGTVIGWFKYNTTKHIRNEFDVPCKRVFQRSYHDHIVRNEKEYWKIWEYIDNNPLKWKEDCFYTK